MTDEVGFVALTKAAPDLPRSLRGILELGEAGLARARAAAAGRAADLRIGDVALDPVIPDPHAIWCLALNFQRHIDETRLTTSPDYPQIFLRVAASQVGHNQPILCPSPKIARAYDYEGELAVIIGKGGRHIPETDAWSHVAGYSCYNEGSVREFQGHNRQFGLGKNFERSGSFGPWLISPDEFGDPYKQTVTTRLNGIDRQHGRLDEMLFTIERLINYLSTGYALCPGDVIVMGAPGALPLRPGERFEQYGRLKVPGVVHMKPGDVVSVEITGLGTLTNPVIADE
jgi:2-keto-4-pentenoate hydratase/2-oxohepta-3-ene-1,7-dioic acid hydratase in catechol pathway